MTFIGTDYREGTRSIFDNEESGLTPIQKFFDDANVFITGGSGFLGILVIEKLLVSCPNISKIFFLIRSKKGKDTHSRLEELFDDVVFSRVRKQCPDFRDKIVAVEGDCEFPCLGICDQDKETLIREVNVILHLAATVRFDEGIRKASFINVRAVRDITKFAHQMKNLKSFLHVSTAFSNCIHSTIKEEVYPSPMNYDRLLTIAESLPDDILSILTPVLLNKYPNTYAFTKQIGEDVIKQEGRGLPIGIHRPAIVVPTYNEPIRGWTNSLFSFIGFSLATYLGIMKTMKVNLDIDSHLVPADIVANSIIASAWDVAENFVKNNNNNQDLPVYNLASDEKSILRGHRYMRLAMKYSVQYPSVKVTWYPFLIICRSYGMYSFLAFFLHYLPCLIMDFVLVCQRKSPIMLKIYTKFNKLADTLIYFLSNDWYFESTNIQMLTSRMSNKDRDIFRCELGKVDWEDYLEHSVLGCRTYLLKESIDTLPEAKRKLNRLYWLHQFSKVVIGSLFLWIVWSLFSLLFRYII